MATIYELRCTRCDWQGTIKDGPLMAGPETWRDSVLCPRCQHIFEVRHRDWAAGPGELCPSCDGPVTRWGDPCGDLIGPCPRCEAKVTIDTEMMAD